DVAPGLGRARESSPKYSAHCSCPTWLAFLEAVIVWRPRSRRRWYNAASRLSPGPPGIADRSAARAAAGLGTLHRPQLRPEFFQCDIAIQVRIMSQPNAAASAGGMQTH